MRSGIDTSALDPAVRPQDDLFAHVNGRWLASTEIPDDRGRYGTFDVLREQAEEHVRAIVEEVATGSPAPGSVGAKVGDLYASFMDEDRVEALGVEPLRADLERIAQVRDAGRRRAPPRVAGTAGRHRLRRPVRQHRQRRPRPLRRLPRAGRHRAARRVVLPRGPARGAARGLRRARRADAHAWRAGRGPRPTPQRVMALETRIAAGHWDKVTNRDPVKTYTAARPRGPRRARPPDRLERLPRRRCRRPPTRSTPSSSGRPTTSARSTPPSPRSRSRRGGPGSRGTSCTTTPPTCRARSSTRTSTSTAAGSPGCPQLRARWKRGVGLLEAALGEAVGQLYVERHFPPRAKERMVELVDHLVEAFRRSFAEVPWMGDATRAEAYAKLEAFTPKIGYPDEWRDYSTLEVDPGDLVGNVRRATAFEVDRDLGKLGGPDRPGRVVHDPADRQRLLQPRHERDRLPGGDPPAAVLRPRRRRRRQLRRHRLGHRPRDRARLRRPGLAVRRPRPAADVVDRGGPGPLRGARATALAEQFSDAGDARRPGPQGQRQAHGRREHRRPRAGSTIGYSAYRISLGGEEAPVLDGLTGDQRFFYGWATNWRGKVPRGGGRAPAHASTRTAPRTCGPTPYATSTEFHEAFGTAEGDGMWLAPEEQRSASSDATRSPAPGRVGLGAADPSARMTG